MLLEDGQNIIKMLVKRVFLIVVTHPLNGERTSAAHYPNQTLVVLHPFERVPGQAAMNGHKINTVNGLLLYGGK